MTTPPPLQRVTADGASLAYRHRPGSGPLLVFLPGYMSDMDGAKATALDAWAAAHGRACLRLDYSGCGSSGGDFDTGSIGRWTADALAVLDAVAAERVVLVGSSMGGWVALCVALERSEIVAGIVGIAAAPDFDDWGLGLDDGDRAQLTARGFIERPSAYGDAPYRYTRAFLDDAPARRVLGGGIALDCPVRLLHGEADADVPAEISRNLAARLRSADVQVTLVKDGDHRLSRASDLALLTRTVAALLENV